MDQALVDKFVGRFEERFCLFAREGEDNFIISLQELYEEVDDDVIPEEDKLTVKDSIRYTFYSKGCGKPLEKGINRRVVRDYMKEVVNKYYDNLVEYLDYKENYLK